MKTRSSGRGGGEPRRLGNVALLTLMLCCVVALSLIRGRFAPIVNSVGDAVKPEPVAMVVSKAAVVGDIEAAAAAGEEKDVEEPTKAAAGDAAGGNEKPPVCRETSRRSDSCEASGDVRVVGGRQTVYVDTLDREWKTRPYCRKHDAYALSHVKEWTLRPLDSSAAPACTSNGSAATAFVLSTGGFTGNPFHDYTDVLIPAFITSRPFRGDVQFLVSGYKAWWVSRYAPVLAQMSRHEVVDVDADGPEVVRCYAHVVVGATFHRELGVDPSRTPGSFSMADFRRTLRDAFGLERAAAAPSGDRWDIRRRPRLLILSRRASRGRAFVNERAMADMAASLGFDVRAVDPDAATDVSKLARLVNSCDVMLGAHGAGLTNMLFLPSGAVVVQVVPYGKLEWLARTAFADPARDAGMELHYIEYAVRLDETTLADQYPADHPVIADPMAIHKQGWNALKTTYLDKQNLRPHLGRLKNTLQQALKMLPHGRDE